jgi:rod shape-determining protein MreC
MPADRHIFREGPAPLRGVVLFGFLAIALLGVNYFTDWLDPVRSKALDLVAPLYRITNIPARLREWSDNSFTSRDEILSENQTLRDQNLILQARVSTMTTVVAENTRLRQLLNAAELLEARVLIAELIGTPPDSETHRLILDKGQNQELFVGQPVLDAQGLVGQVVFVGDEYSEVLLISDRDHAVPVQNLRNGVRAIAEGTGDFNRIRLRDIPVTMDIVAGDSIVTSGLGERFPKGYPVGQVSSVSVLEGSPFLEVEIRPESSLQTTGHMLLLFSGWESRVLSQRPPVQRTPSRFNGNQ